MTTDFERTRQIFLAIVEQSSAQWEALLNEACADDPDLHQQVGKALTTPSSGPGSWLSIVRSDARKASRKSRRRAVLQVGRVFSPYGLPLADIVSLTRCRLAQVVGLVASSCTRSKEATGCTPRSARLEPPFVRNCRRAAPAARDVVPEQADAARLVGNATNCRPRVLLSQQQDCENLP
jgi:hypothetical protein